MTVEVQEPSDGFQHKQARGREGDRDRPSPAPERSEGAHGWPAEQAEPDVVGTAAECEPYVSERAMPGETENVDVRQVERAEASAVTRTPATAPCLTPRFPSTPPAPNASNSHGALRLPMVALMPPWPPWITDMTAPKPRAPTSKTVTVALLPRSMGEGYRAGTGTTLLRSTVRVPPKIVIRSRQGRHLPPGRGHTE